MSDTITIYAERGGCYFPIYVLDVGKLETQGFDQRFMLAFAGQIDQLYSPVPPAGSTPQVERPVHPANSTTGGKPDRTNRTRIENVTVLFATGHSKVLSSIDRSSLKLASSASGAPQSSEAARNN